MARTCCSRFSRIKALLWSLRNSHKFTISRRSEGLLNIAGRPSRPDDACCTPSRRLLELYSEDDRVTIRTGGSLANWFFLLLLAFASSSSAIRARICLNTMRMTAIITTPAHATTMSGIISTLLSVILIQVDGLGLAISYIIVACNDEWRYLVGLAVASRNGERDARKASGVFGRSYPPVGRWSLAGRFRKAETKRGGEEQATDPVDSVNVLIVSS